MFLNLQQLKRYKKNVFDVLVCWGEKTVNTRI